MKIRTNEFINKAFEQMSKTNRSLSKKGYDKQIRQSEFDRLIKSNLSNTDVLKSLRMSRKSPTTSMYDKERLERLQKDLRTQVKSDYRDYSKMDYYKYGEKMSGNLLWNNLDLDLQLKRKYERTLKDIKDIDNVKDEIRILEKLLEQPDYKDYQERGLKLLEYARDESGANEMKANEVIERIRRLKPEDYNKLYYQERILNKLIHAYNNFSNLKNKDKQLQAYELEIAGNFENMFESLEQILANDYSYVFDD